MMYYIVQGLLGFIAATAFGILFNAPKKALIPSGLVGMTGWLIYVFIDQSSGNPILSSFSGAFTIAFIAHLFSKSYKMPMIIFSVAGIIPLVPGGIAYNSMRNMVQSNYVVAMENVVLALMISGSIAMGLVFAEIITQLSLKVIGRLKTKP